MITVNNSFSLKLKELRQKNNLTQDQLADELNARYHLNESKATISQYVNNKRTPEIDKMVKIADFFNVTLDYIMCRTDIDSDMSIYDKSKKNISFSTPQEAVSFILSQKVIADLGGYSLDSISNTEIMGMTNDIIDIFCIISRKHK